MEATATRVGVILQAGARAKTQRVLTKGTDVLGRQRQR